MHPIYSHVGEPDHEGEEGTKGANGVVDSLSCRSRSNFKLALMEGVAQKGFVGAVVIHRLHRVSVGPSIVQEVLVDCEARSSTVEHLVRVEDRVVERHIIRGHLETLVLD